MFDSNTSSSLQDRVLSLTVALYRVTDYFPKAEILRNHLRAKADEIFERLMEYGDMSEPDEEIRPLIHKIRTIKGYLAIAGTLNYVRSLNFTILEKEYGLIEQFLESERIKRMRRPVHEDIQRLAHKSMLRSGTGQNGTRSIAAPHNRESGKNLSSDQGEERIAAHHADQETEERDEPFYERKDERINERQKVIIDRLKQTGHAKISDLLDSFHGVSSKTIQRDLQNLVDRQVLKKEGEKRWTIYSLPQDHDLSVL